MVPNKNRVLAACRSLSQRRVVTLEEAETIALLRETMLLVLKLAGPPLLVGLAVGLVVSLLQTVTQINEATLAFVPKVLAVGAVLMLLGPFMLATMTDHTHLLFDRLIAIGGE
jgi:flagellar biosynthetic protein FliQ